MYIKIYILIFLHQQKDVLELATTALVELLRSQSNLADDIPVLGHIPKLFNLLSVQPKSTLSVLHQLSLSEVSNCNMFSL